MRVCVCIEYLFVCCVPWGKRVMRNLFRIPLLEAYSIYKASMMSIHLTDFFLKCACIGLSV